jgi:RNA polymerase sigma factor (sigma-70 family)
MARSLLNRVVRQLREVSCRQAPPLADRDLLRQFVREKDERAFAALVHRHGPMVLGVCRRILRNAADAEDAFQVVFLVLVRKAPSLRAPDSLGNWLYGVAYRTALEAKRAAARRKVKEAQAMPRMETSMEYSSDLLALLDEELAALPDTFRAAVVLCDLEGKTRKVAAQELACAEGTVASRVARGRVLLAARLARRGVTLSAGALAVALSQGVCSAQLPVPLVATTVEAAALLAAGKVAGVSTPVAVLLKGMLRAMLIAKLKVVTGTFLVVALMFGAGGLAYQSVGAQGPPEKRAAAQPPSELEALRREIELLKLNNKVLLEILHARETELRAHKAQADQVRGVAFSPDGRLIARETNDGVVRLWDVTTGKEAGVEPGKAPGLSRWLDSRPAPDKQQLRRTADELEKLVKQLREQAK